MRSRSLVTLVASVVLVGCAGDHAPTSAPDAGPSDLARPDAEPTLTQNLLCNPSFEEGAGEQPECWKPFSPGSGKPTYTWSTRASAGKRGAALEGADPKSLGMWQQIVAVAEDTVYLVSAQVGFEGIEPPGRCHLQLVFRGEGQELLSMLDLPSHSRSRALDLDFPTGLKVRAPTGARSAEVNLVLAGVGKAFFDEVSLQAAPLGTVAGQISVSGQPLAEAKVSIVGKPWGKEYSALTDANGRYSLPGLPVAFPRYVLKVEKAGHRTRSAGRIAIHAAATTTVDLELEPGSDPKSPELHVIVAQLDLELPQQPPRFPDGATIPAEESGYPAQVRPFLAADEQITSTHPEIVALAKQIVSGVPEAKRSSTREVAWAVYEWISRTIDHDGVYDLKGELRLEHALTDITSGIWQTIGERDWGFGKSFLDWAYRPYELIKTRGGICVEHAWLGSALLRALRIPARAYSGAAELWAQTPDGKGVWIGFSTTGGRTAYRERGELGSGFEGPPLMISPVLSRPILHEDWDATARGLWRERHPSQASYEGTAAGKQQALAELEALKTQGTLPKGGKPSQGGQHHVLHVSDLTLSLLDLPREQTTLEVRVPLVTASARHAPEGTGAHWTSRPECQLGVEVKELENPPVEGKERWYTVRFDTTYLTK
jgi:hypothetical protein